MRTTREKIIRSSLFFSTLTLVFLAYADTVLAQNTSAAITIGFLDLFKNPGMFLGWVGAEILLRVAGLFTWIGGVILNTSLNVSVLDMSKIVSGTSSINTAWGTLRDLANIVFIFLLLAIGIGTILRLPGYGIKQLLAQVLIVAVLINFSLFFTKLIIDVPNRLAVEFYNGLSISYCTDTQNPGTCTKAGLSDRFMNAMKISTLFDVRSIQNKFGTEAAAATLSGGNIFLIGIFGSVFLLIAGFIFFAAGILLAIRFAVLIILMVLSPLAFVFMVIPYTKKYASDWWSKLFSNAFFAPAYLLLTWISLKIIEDQNFFYQGKNSSSDSFAAAFTQGGDALPIVFNFMVVSVFMVASLVVASKMGAYGAGGMLQIGQSLRKWGQGMLGHATFGATGALFRNTIGRGASKISSLEGFKDYASKSRLGDLLMRGTRGVARSGFDVRSTALGKAAAGPVGGLGTAFGKGGYEEKMKQQKKDRTDFAESLKGKTLSEEQQNEIDVAKRSISKDGQLNKDLEAAKQELRDARKTASTASFTDEGTSAAQQTVKEKEDLVQTRNEALRQATDRTSQKIKDILGNKQGADRRDIYQNRIKEQSEPETLYMKVPRKNAEAAMEVKKKLEKEGYYDDAKSKELSASIEKLVAENKRMTEKLSSDLQPLEKEMGKLRQQMDEMNHPKFASGAHDATRQDLEKKISAVSKQMGDLQGSVKKQITENTSKANTLEKEERKIKRGREERNIRKLIGQVVEDNIKPDIMSEVEKKMKPEEPGEK